MPDDPLEERVEQLETGLEEAGKDRLELKRLREEVASLKKAAQALTEALIVVARGTTSIVPYDQVLPHLVTAKENAYLNVNEGSDPAVPRQPWMK